MIAENKVLVLINKLKASHNGPVTSVEELHETLRKYPDKVSQILTLEIRFRKVTLTKIKTVCPLFKDQEP